MKISDKDMARFKDMAIQLKASSYGDAVRSGYAMEVLLSRVEELESAVPEKVAEHDAVFVSKTIKTTKAAK